MRDSFVFYRSFIQAIEMLDKGDQLNALLGIIHYALDGVEPTGEGIPQVVFTLVKPVIDGNTQKYFNGKKGGRPKKEKNLRLSEAETNGFKNGKANEDVDVDVDEDGDKGKHASPSTGNKFNNFENGSYANVEDLEKKLLQRKEKNDGN